MLPSSPDFVDLLLVIVGRLLLWLPRVVVGTGVAVVGRLLLLGLDMCGVSLGLVYDVI